jgi:sterol desaturase/sphingolipid hydroxylase (fatty acid hydroxylase superfamily)
MVGQLANSALHDALHAKAPPFKWMQPLWHNHHLHHYQDEHHGYGVSSLLWDNVFHTAFDLDNFKVERKKTDELSVG